MEELPPPTPSKEGIGSGGGVAYLESVVGLLTNNQREELNAFGLPDDVIVYAADEASANGKPQWAYARGILANCVKCGVATVAEAKARGKETQLPEARKPKYRWVSDDYEEERDAASKPPEAWKPRRNKWVREDDDC